MEVFKLTSQQVEKRLEEIYRENLLLKEIQEYRKKELIVDTWRSYERYPQTWKPTVEHIKLVNELSFHYYPEGGDWVFVGCEGKRPFGNSSVYDDAMHRILKWRKNNGSEYSKPQYDKIEKIFSELGWTINWIIDQCPHTT